MTFRRYTSGEYSTFYTSDIAYIVYPKNYDPATVKFIIGCHGHGANGFQYGLPPLDGHTNALVDAGYVFMGIDHARINAWGDSGAMSAISDAYLSMLNWLGRANTPKVGVMGWSMGGLTALNWVRRNAQFVACAWVWNPASDPRFMHDGTGLYTPTYSGGGITQGNSGYAAEQDTTFAASGTIISVSTGATIPALGGAGIQINLGTGQGREFNDGLAGPVTATVNGANFTYTSVSNNHYLNNCVSTTATPITIAVNNVVTSTYAQQIAGYNPWVDAAAYGTLGLPIKVSQATDDSTVPPMMNLDPANGFIARANSTNVTSAGTITGGHVLSISNTPTQPVVDFYKAYL